MNTLPERKIEETPNGPRVYCVINNRRCYIHKNQLELEQYQKSKEVA